MYRGYDKIVSYILYVYAKRRKLMKRLAIDIGTTNIEYDMFDTDAGQSIFSLRVPNCNLSFGLDVMTRITKANELAQKISKIYVGDEGNVARKVVKIYVGDVGNKAKLIYKADGIVINPGAYTHYSYAIHDALKSVGMMKVEIHISDVDNREDFRKISVTAPACDYVIKGHGLPGYLEAIDYIVNNAN